MKFEADPAKAAQNLKKHKVSFEEAASVLGDSMAYSDYLIAVDVQLRSASCHIAPIAADDPVADRL